MEDLICVLKVVLNIVLRDLNSATLKIFLFNFFVYADYYYLYQVFSLTCYRAVTFADPSIWTFIYMFHRVGKWSCCCVSKEVTDEALKRLLEFWWCPFYIDFVFLLRLLAREGGTAWMRMCGILVWLTFHLSLIFIIDKPVIYFESVVFLMIVLFVFASNILSCKISFSLWFFLSLPLFYHGRPCFSVM